MRSIPTPRHITRRDVHKALAAATLALASRRFWSAPVHAQPTPRSFAYTHLDVFTDRVLTGNQLAVFLAPQGLDTETMQAIAREVNFSESTFVFPREAADTDFRVRIFATNRELAFAGHPVIGTIFALADAGTLTPMHVRVVLGLGAGPTPVDLEWRDGRLRFAWMTQQLPTFGTRVADTRAVAAAIGLDPASIAGSNLPLQEVTCGSWFFFVPLSTREAVDRVALNRAAIEAVFAAAGMENRGVMVFSTAPHGDGAHVYSRMMSLSGSEDPATGSAAGPLACYLTRYQLVPAAQASQIVGIQGVKMRRPSRLHMSVSLQGDAITRVRVGGESVITGSGTIRLPLA